MKDRIPLGAADLLALGAAPTFALMALVTLLLGDGQSALFCTQAGTPSLLAGMVPMYLLMAAVHLAPWFRLTSPRPAA